MATTKTYTFKSEKDVKRHIKKLLDTHGWYHWMPPANGFGKGGISDHNALRAGVFLAVEAKYGGNKPSENQKDYLRDISAQDGIAFVVDDKTIGWLEIWLIAFDRGIAAQHAKEEIVPEDGAAMVNAMRVLSEPYMVKDAK